MPLRPSLSVTSAGAWPSALATVVAPASPIALSDRLMLVSCDKWDPNSAVSDLVPPSPSPLPETSRTCSFGHRWTHPTNAT
eukprot:30903-Rhodomonas_salina.1